MICDIILLFPSFFHYTSVNCIIVYFNCVILYHDVSLFTCFVIIVFTATEVMTVFVFHEPSQLSALQDNGLPGVVLNSLLMKNVSHTGDLCDLAVHWWSLADPCYPRSVKLCSEHSQCVVSQC